MLFQVIRLYVSNAPICTIIINELDDVLCEFIQTDKASHWKRWMTGESKRKDVDMALVKGELSNFHLSHKIETILCIGSMRELLFQEADKTMSEAYHNLE